MLPLTDLNASASLQSALPIDPLIDPLTVVAAPYDEVAEGDVAVDGLSRERRRQPLGRDRRR